jgi:predicted TIM-barrel fold metal-dependent hydrolase
VQLDVQIVDNHCHALSRVDPVDGPRQLRASLAEVGALAATPGIVETTVHYRWSIAQLCDRMGCAPSEQAFIDARARIDPLELAASYLSDAGVAWLLIDDGFPPSDESRPMEDIAAAAGARTARIVRIETLAETLLARCATVAQLTDAVVAALETALDEGAVALKSIAAYRTGLHIEDHSEAAVSSALADARGTDRGRIEGKALVDHLVHVGLEVASRRGCPVQFHTGHGDADARFAACDPLLLQHTIARFPEVPFVLLHGAYPFTRHGAVLAATHPNVHLDLSYLVPFLSRDELEHMTCAALGAAPTSRLLYSSDGFRIPEHYWLGAVRGRSIIASSLRRQVAQGTLDKAQAESDFRGILHDNAVRLYALPTS